MYVYLFNYETGAYVSEKGWVTYDYILNDDYGVKFVVAYFDDRTLADDSILEHVTVKRAGFRDESDTVNDGSAVTLNNDFTNRIIQLNRKATPSETTDVLSILHFSDLHGSEANLKNIVEFVKKYTGYIDDVIHTGDGVTSYFADDNPFDNVDGSSGFMNVIGNHECFIEGDSWYNATGVQVYTKFFAPHITEWGVTQPANAADNGYCYYYKDYAAAKIRLIVLDGCHWDATQDIWFDAVLADAITEGLSVVCATHYPPMTGLTKEDCTFSTLDKTLLALSGRMERQAEEAYAAVEAFIVGGGEFVCWLSGHTHSDFFGVVADYTDQTIVIVENSRLSSSNNDSHRISNTLSQNSFNVIGFDTVSKLIKIVRYGNDTDRYLRRKRTLCFNYDTKTLIVND